MQNPTGHSAPLRRPGRISFDLAVLVYESFDLRAIVLDGEPWFMLHDLEMIVPTALPLPGVLARYDVIRVRTEDLGRGRTRLLTNEKYAVLLSEYGAVEACVRAGRRGSLDLARWITHEAAPVLRAAGLREASSETLPLQRHRIDVARHDTDPRPHVVYRFYGDAGELLYVGISLAAVQRMSAHKSNQPWWPDVARVDFVHYPDREAARAAEKVAIQDERPRYNIAS